MRTIAILGVVAVLGGFGCASTGGLAAGGRELAGVARPSLHVGEAYVVVERIHPRLVSPLLPIDGKEARVELGGGRFLTCWTEGSLERGRRLLAQAFNADGSPEGEAVVVSPDDVDVLGAPEAVATDGHRVVATFAAASERSVDLLSVPIETAGVVAAGGERTAQR